jgi:hypothetical protein
MENEDILIEYKNLLIEFDKALTENKGKRRLLNEVLANYKAKLSNYNTPTTSNTGLIDGIVNDVTDLSNNIGDKYDILCNKIRIIINHINNNTILINKKPS